MNALVRCPQCGRETPAAGAPGQAPRCRHCAATLYGAKPVSSAPKTDKSKIALVGGLIAGGVLLLGGCLAIGIVAGIATFFYSGAEGPPVEVSIVPGGTPLGGDRGPTNATIDAPVPELPPLKQSLGDSPGAGEFDPATEVVPYEEPVEDPVYLPQSEWNVAPDPYAGEAPSYSEQPIASSSDPLVASLNGPFVVIDMPALAARGPWAGLQAEEASAAPSKLIDLRTGETAGTFPPQAPTWRNGRLSPDGTRLVGPDTAPDAAETLDEGKLFVWERDKKEPSATIELTGMLLWMDFVANDRIATATVDEELALVPRIGRPGENVIIAVSRTPRFRVWDVATGKNVLDVALPEDTLAYRRTEVWSPEFMAQKGLLPDGKTEVMREYFWETEAVEALEKNQSIRRLYYVPRRGYGAVSAGGKRVALLGRHHVSIVSVADGKVLGRLPLAINRTRYDARGLSFSPDGKLLYGVIDERNREMQSGDGAGEFMRLITWSLADGRRASDPQLGPKELVGRAVPAPYPQTVLLSEVAPGRRIGRANVPIACVLFDVTIAADPGEGVAIPVRMRHYRKVFASYASENRDEVIGRLQGVFKVRPDLDVFLDVADLRSGDRWQERLEAEIEGRDALYLFWSKAASASSWVDREWRCAYVRRGIDFIDPIPLAPPAEAPPPAELASLHFNEWLLAFRKQRET